MLIFFYLFFLDFNCTKQCSSPCKRSLSCRCSELTLSNRLSWAPRWFYKPLFAMPTTLPLDRTQSYASVPKTRTCQRRLSRTDRQITPAAAATAASAAQQHPPPPTSRARFVVARPNNCVSTPQYRTYNLIIILLCVPVELSHK